ncbi:hypothetical protein DITRI_Ditri18aG0048800 [Diplodiscus trichospermus]
MNGEGGGFGKDDGDVGELLRIELDDSGGEITEVEAYGVLQALKWLRSMRCSKVIIETDCKVVVDSLHSQKVDMSEFGMVICQCKELLVLEQDFSVRFVRRQAK